MTTLAKRLTTWRYVMNHANMPGAFIHTRRAGGLLILGLFLNAVLPGLRLPWT